MNDFSRLPLPLRFGAYAEDWFARNRERARHTYHAQVHLTMRCQRSCQHCYFRTITGSAVIDMPTSLAKSLITSVSDEALALGLLPSIDLTGGDPVLHPDFWHILDHASRSGARIVIKGNPESLDSPTLARIRDLGVASVRLSIEGIRPVNDSIRGVGSYDAIMQASSLVKESGIMLGLHTTISPSNAHQLAPIINDFLECGLLVDDYTWSRFWSDDATCMQTGASYREMVASWIGYLRAIFGHPEFYRLTSDGRLVPRVFVGFKEHILYPWLVDAGVLAPDGENDEGADVQTNCTANRHVYIVDTDGEVSKCRKMPSFGIGNAFDSGWATVVHSPEATGYLRMREATECSLCGHYARCGGCRAIASTRAGSWAAIDPDCPRPMQG